MSHDPFAPPGETPGETPAAPAGGQPPYWVAPLAGPPSSPWGPPVPGAWTPAPWGPPGWESHGPGPNVVVPIDPYETVLYHRRRALWYGLAALGLAVVAPWLVLTGAALLLFGVPHLLLLGLAALAGGVAFAVASLVTLARHGGDGAAQAGAAVPAVLALGVTVFVLVAGLDRLVV